MKNIKGLIIQFRLEFIEERLGADAFKNFIHSLSLPTQEILRSPVLPSSSYSFSILKEIDERLPQVIDKPLEPLFREIGAYSAPKIVDRYFYNYVSSREPRKFLFQYQRLYPILWGFGKVTVEESAQQDHQFDVSFSYEQDIHKPYCWFMQSFLEHAVRFVGAPSVTLIERECDAENGERCWYQIQWSGE